MYKRAAKGWAKHLDFVILDLICISLSLMCAYVIRHGRHNFLKSDLYRELYIVALLIDFVVILVFEVYKNVLRRGMYHEFLKKFEQAFLVFLFLTAFMFVSKVGDDYSRTTVILMAVFYLFSSYLVTIIEKAIVKHSMKHAKDNPMLIVTSTETGSEVVAHIKANNYNQNFLAGIVLADEAADVSEIEGIPVVATIATIADFIKENWIDEVFIDYSKASMVTSEVVRDLINMGVTVQLAIDSTIYCKKNIGSVGDMPVISMSINYMTQRQAFVKRLFDIVGGLVGCIFTGLLFIFIAPIIKLKSPGPVFFSQTRLGQNGKPFKLYKFRSMYMDAEARRQELMDQNRISDGRMFKIEFDPRIIGNRIDEKTGKRKTGIGEFIRKTSIDEFPQFFNVLKGDMSLVGTRPPLPDEVANYEAHHKIRLAVKPGITGLWQVSGRSNILDFEEVVKLDAQYLERWSFGLDLKILLKTILVVFKKEGSM